MKKMFFFLTVSLFTLSSFSQTLNTTLSKDDYLLKSKNQNTTAWILLAGGTTMVIVGLANFSDSYDYGSESSTDITGFVVLGGIVVDLISIPLFISSAKNKRKAASFSFEPQKLLVPQHNTSIPKQQMALTLRIGL